MAIVVKKYIGSNGEILLPLSQNDTNSANLVSISGVFYLAVKEDVSSIVAGNPIGLLLALTYSATP